MKPFVIKTILDYFLGNLEGHSFFLPDCDLLIFAKNTTNLNLIKITRPTFQTTKTHLAYQQNP